MHVSEHALNRVKELLRELKRHGGIVVVGVGNPLRGDDGVGVLVAQRLKGRGLGGSVVVAEANPENFIAHIASRKPKVVIFIDAVDAGLEPGSVVFAPLPDAERECRVVGTHNIPLSLILRLVGDVEGYVLGIQAASTGIGDRMHPSVLRAAEAVSELLEEALSSSGDAPNRNIDRGRPPTNEMPE